MFVAYCSCDIHFGDAAQDYPLHVEHRGYHNAKVAEKYAREHFLAPEAVFVTGSSAGAYGAWFNGPLLESVWPSAQFDVLADAGNGVVTQEFLTQFFPNWNFEANLPPEIPELKTVLDNGEGIPGYTKVIARTFPNTDWAHYATAFDGGSGGQTGFYNLMLNGNDVTHALTWWEGSCAFRNQMKTQAVDTAAAIDAENGTTATTSGRAAGHDVGLEQGLRRHDGRRADAGRLGERHARERPGDAVAGVDERRSESVQPAALRRSAAEPAGRAVRAVG